MSERIGPYTIERELGRGGMGVVYLARDDRLNRSVAIKVLPPEFADHPERLARFEHEARVLAALNHPNVAAIYGLEEAAGSQHLILEYVEGETLADILSRGPLPVQEALEISAQIARGLEAAHGAGIIHRDLKPANVKVTPDGQVKVLDFGLAKGAAPAGEGSGPDLTRSPTVTYPATLPGMIMGTAAYMSPEQARGKPVDNRTDIWSFGCVLYEVLSGRPVFSGETLGDLMVEILERQPRWEELDEKTPPRVRNLVGWCLEKQARDRLHHIADARIELERALENQEWTAAGGAEAALPGVSRRWLAAGLAAGGLVLGLLVGGVGGWIWKEGGAASGGRVVRAAIPLPQEAPVRAFTHRPVAISPDGSRIVYVAAGLFTDRKKPLYLRHLGDSQVRPIPGTEGGVDPFFSPDGDWIGFIDEETGYLKRISIAPGTGVSTALVVCDTPAMGGAVWTEDGEIIFRARSGEARGLKSDAGLLVVSAFGGEPRILTTLDREGGEQHHVWPELLPDGETLLYTAPAGPPVSEGPIYAHSLDSGERRLIVESGAGARYAPSGHLLYMREGVLVAAPFDAERLELAGAPVPVLDGVTINPESGQADYAFARDGTLIYVQGQPQALANLMVWVDEEGQATPAAREQRSFYHPRISPDGSQIAVTILEEAAEIDVWLYDVRREVLSRLTFGGTNVSPVWSPDGRWIAFASRLGSSNAILWTPADGSGAPEELYKSAMPVVPNSFSADGRTLAFTAVDAEAKGDLWMLSLDGSGARPFLETPSSEFGAMFSPDGRWVAFVSNETGRNEVYVQPARADASRGRRRISTDGGAGPAWSADGRQIVYHRGSSMMAVDLVRREDGGLIPSAPRLLFERRAQLVSHVWTPRNYDVRPGGEGFLLISAAQAGTAPGQIEVVFHWLGELARLVPPAGRGSQSSG